MPLFAVVGPSLVPFPPPLCYWKVYIEDLCKEFVTDFVFEAVKANAMYEGRYLLGTRRVRGLTGALFFCCNSLTALALAWLSFA